MSEEGGGVGKTGEVDKGEAMGADCGGQASERPSATARVGKAACLGGRNWGRPHTT